MGGFAGGCPAGRICRIFSDKRRGKRDNIFTYNANFIPLQGKGEHTIKNVLVVVRNGHSI